MDRTPIAPGNAAENPEMSLEMGRRVPRSKPSEEVLSRPTATQVENGRVGLNKTSRPSSQERVRAALAAHGLVDLPVREFAESTATAVDAAAAIGTTVERIVKSLVFNAGDDPILVLVSGPNRVDTDKLAQLLGLPIRRANADQVRQRTGFAIGGVPPLGHIERLQTFIDHGLLQYDEVWASAGTPNSVFAITPPDLVRVSGAQVVDVAS